jgi:hypothetical protein
MAETVTLPQDIQRRLDVWKAIGALLVCALYGWFALVRNAQTPVLEFADIAVHEMGHKVFSPFGELTMLIMGSGSQVLFPLLLGVMFAVWKRNLIAWGVCWAWAANAMSDAARYIYDAPRGELALLGGDGSGLGDWTRILGPEHLDKVYLAERLAADVRAAAFVTWFAAVGIVVFALVRTVAAIRREDGAVATATARPSGELAPVGDVDMWRR